MASPTFPGDLAHHGWSDRVQALVAAADRPDLRPARVLRVDRDRCLVITASGETTATADALPTVGDWVVLHDRAEPTPTRPAPPSASPRCCPAGRSSPATAPARPPRPRSWRPTSTSCSSPPASTGRCDRAASSASSSWRGTAAPGRWWSSPSPTPTPTPTAAAADLADPGGRRRGGRHVGDRRSRRRRGAGADRAERHGRAARRVGRRQVDARQPPAGRGPLRHRRGPGGRQQGPAHHGDPPPRPAARRRRAHRHAGPAQHRASGRRRRGCRSRSPTSRSWPRAAGSPTASTTPSPAARSPRRSRRAS